MSRCHPAILLAILILLMYSYHRHVAELGEASKGGHCKHGQAAAIGKTLVESMLLQP